MEWENYKIIYESKTSIFDFKLIDYEFPKQPRRLLYLSLHDFMSSVYINYKSSLISITKDVYC